MNHQKSHFLLIGKTIIKYISYFEYHENSLEHEILERKSNSFEFSGPQLWSIAKSLIVSNAFLQENSMKHGDLRPAFIIKTTVKIPF